MQKKYTMIIWWQPTKTTESIWWQPTKFTEFIWRQPRPPSPPGFAIPPPRSGASTSALLSLSLLFACGLLVSLQVANYSVFKQFL